MYNAFLQENAVHIRRELERITGSWEFYNSRRLQEVLTFLVEETLAGRGPEIKAYTIATEVMGRPPSFDPQTDAVVRVVAGKLRKRLDRFYGARGTLAPVKISIPVGKYMPLFTQCETSSPAAENGRATKKPAEHSKSSADDADNPGIMPTPASPPGAAPHTDFIPPVAETGSSTARQAPDVHSFLKPRPSAPAVLVYPFFDLSPETELSHIVNGFVDEIIIGLTRFNDFKVISANYCPHAVGHTAPHPVEAPWELARQLGARFILQGNIQIFGDNMRVRVVLTDALTRSSIWAERYDADFHTHTVFQVLDEISNKVLAGIAGSFGFINKVLLAEVEQENVTSPPVQFSVYEAVLCYHHWIGTLNAENEQKARTALEAAVAAAPHYGLAKAMLADIYATASQWHPDDKEAARLEERSLELALEAEALTPSCQYVQWAKSLNAFLRKQEAEFINAARLALAINPANTNLVNAVGMRLIAFGRRDEGFEIIENSRRYNPFLPD
ncbi:MAG: hypothetical protein IJD04_07040, partial [Desulfovibrionaceae bacterium]|nr:hypothetical protein [Desulfovibrionaceae bacterium]